jgi:thiamine biosynthesis lipoprotein
MGTGYVVKVAAPPADLAADELQADIDAWLADFDLRVSTYRPDSELSRFNASRTTDWFEVSAETARLVQSALQIAERSGGAFDPTVGPLVRLWGFDRRQGRATLPTEAELLEMRQRVGHQLLQVRLDPPALRKSHPELELDVNGIAPGFAADRLVERLAHRGLHRVMVDIGGEIRAQGDKSDGSPWRIGVERPPTSDGEARRLAAALPLNDAAVATSGDYRNFYEVDGRRYAHTIDPRTGRPVDHALASVTVFAPDAADADALATALMVLGPEEGLALADELGLAAWLLVRDSDHGLRTVASTAFQEGVGRDLELQQVEHSQAPHDATAQSPSAAAARGEADVGAAAPSPWAVDAPAGGSSPWTTLLMAVGVFGAAMAGLAAGVLLRGRPLRGSCGGLAGMRDEQGRPMCSTCTTPPEQCEEFRQAAARDEGQDHAAG